MNKIFVTVQIKPKHMKVKLFFLLFNSLTIINVNNVAYITYIIYIHTHTHTYIYIYIYTKVKYIYFCYCLLLSPVQLVWPHGLATRLLCLWDSPGKNTRMGCHFFLQGIFLTKNQTHIFCFGRQGFVLFWFVLPVNH